MLTQTQQPGNGRTITRALTFNHSRAIARALTSRHSSGVTRALAFDHSGVVAQATVASSRRTGAVGAHA